MGFVDVIRKSINQLFKRKKDNAFGDDAAHSALSLFSGAYRKVGNNHLHSFLGSATYSYNLTIAVGQKNIASSRAIRMLTESIQYLAMIDDDDQLVETPLTNEILGKVKEQFGNDNLVNYIYLSILHRVCCGMNIVAPLKTNENGFAERLQLLDPRKISITVNPSGDETVNYNGKKLTDYKKTIFLPNPNRQGYGDCEFASAIDDAILDQATRATAIAFYKNDASPGIVFKLRDMMGDEVIDSDQVEHFGDKLKTKFQGVDNHGTPLYSNVIEDIKIIDNTKAIVSGLDGRLYNSNMVAMALGLDLRSLGYMRAGGSQAELKEVLKMANAKITRTAEELSAKLQEEFEALVQELPKGLYFKFIPTLFRDVQQVMDNYLKAHQQGAVSNEELLDLLHNQ